MLSDSEAAVWTRGEREELTDTVRVTKKASLVYHLHIRFLKFKYYQKEKFYKQNKHPDKISEEPIIPQDFSGEPQTGNKQLRVEI